MVDEASVGDKKGELWSGLNGATRTWESLDTLNYDVCFPCPLDWIFPPVLFQL